MTRDGARLQKAAVLEFLAAMMAGDGVFCNGRGDAEPLGRAVGAEIGKTAAAGQRCPWPSGRGRTG